MPQRYQISEDDALQVWKALEALTESMVRLGRLEITQGPGKAASEILRYFGPPLAERMEGAKQVIEHMLLSQNPEIESKLWDLSEDEAGMGYWGYDL